MPKAAKKRKVEAKPESNLDRNEDSSKSTASATRATAKSSIKKQKVSQIKTRGPTKMKAKPVQQEDMEELDSQEADKAQFEEDGNVVQITVSKGDKIYEDDESESDGELTPEEGDEEDEDSEIVFSSQNNNASVDLDRSECASMPGKQVQMVARKVQKGQGRKRLSMEEKIDKLSNSIVEMQNIILKRSKMDETEERDHSRERSKSRSILEEDRDARQRSRDKGETNPTERELIEQEINTRFSGSETTVYRNAVQPVQLQLNKGDKRISSSSEEEQVNTSDEMFEETNDQFINNFIQGVRADEYGGHGNEDEGATGGERRPNAGVDRARQLVKEAENAKAKMFRTPGKDANEIEILRSMLQALLVDEKYLMVGSHVDDTIKRKIMNNEYIDFARLLSRDRAGMEEDAPMKMVNRNGVCCYVPVKEGGGITSFAK